MSMQRNHICMSMNVNVNVDMQWHDLDKYEYITKFREITISVEFTVELSIKRLKR